MDSQENTKENKNMDKRRNMRREKLGILDMVFFTILFIPFLLIDLFHIANETTEYERMGRNRPSVDTERRSEQ